MGNISSSGGSRRRRRRNHLPPPPTPPPQAPPPPPPPEMSANQYVFAAATPYPNHYPNPNPNSAQFYQYPGYYPPPPPPMPLPLPSPYYQPWAAGGRFPCGQVMGPPLPYIDHQKAVTIRNDVNLKKDTLRLVADEDNPGRWLVSFTFDATVPGSITVIFFAKEGEDCNLTATKPENLPPVTINFEQGLGQKFRQPSGTGIDFSCFSEAELAKPAESDIYPLAVKAESSPTVENGYNGNSSALPTNAQITQAVFEKERGEYKARVVKQILWVNGMRYELQEIFGIGNTVEDAAGDANDPGKECVICLSEPRDTTVLPCRHMCMCSGCAKVLRFQTSRCPICRQPVERLLEIKVDNGTEE